MSLIEQLHEARRVRLIRMGAPSPYQASLPTPVEGTPAKPKQKLRNVQEPYFRDMWFGDLIWPRVPFAKHQFSFKEIRDVVCLYFDLTPSDISSPQRHKGTCYARQVLFFFAYTRTKRPYSEIGRKLGNRDHTTVMHGVRKIDHLRLSDWRVAYDIAMVEQLL